MPLKKSLFSDKAQRYFSSRYGDWEFDRVADYKGGMAQYAIVSSSGNHHKVTAPNGGDAAKSIQNELKWDIDHSKI